MDLRRFRKKPLLGILRGIKSEELDPLFEVILSSGLEAVEITMNTPCASDLIAQAVKRYGKRIMIGAGTVLSLQDLREALRVGATFIVSPVLHEPIISSCVKNGIPVFPGALTPQEVHNAWEAGATMVKVFPAGCLGPEYFSELKGPFNGIELLACSGVTPENLPDYLSHGASAAAIGSGTFRREWIEAGQFDLIQKRIKTYLSNLHS